MVSPDEQIQLQYELAMSIGQSLNLKIMLRQCISTILRKVNFRAGGVYLLKHNVDGHHYYEYVFSIPRNIDRIEEFKPAAAHLAENLTQADLDRFIKKLPLAGRTQTGKFYYMVELPGVGVIVLLRDRKKLDPLFLKSLGPIFEKLADACIACLQNQELIRHKDHLQELVVEKSQEVFRRNHALEEKVKELEEAYNQIKTLSGLLPICAVCKKIRDDNGYWNQIESYIQAHSGAEFSHSLCPECSEKMYGHEDWYLQIKAGKKKGSNS